MFDLTNVVQVVITMTAKTIVEYTAGHEGYRCGYCQSPSTKCSHGLWLCAVFLACMTNVSAFSYFTFK